MIDTHAHIHLPEFHPDRAQVLTRAFALGLRGLLEVCIAAAQWPAVRRLAEADPRIVATLGIHPHGAGPEAPRALARLARDVGHPRVVAIGETGLDAARGHADREDQQVLLGAHVGLARETGLPLVIHCREAFDEILPLLDREGRGEVRGVFHCFSGGLAEARQVIGRGFAIGLGGAVTYAPERWRPVLRALPGASLLLETDAPYLRPAPARGRRNEPGCVYQVAAVVAELRGETFASLEAQTDDNAQGLFGAAWTRPPRPAASPAAPPANGGEGR